MPLIPKEIIKPGVYHTHDGTVVASPRRLARWVDEFRKMKERGLAVPVPLEHQDDAKPCNRADRLAHEVMHNAGFVDDLWLAKDGSMWGMLDIPDEKNATHAIHNVRYVSPEIESEFTDGDGNKWEDVFTHVALTPRPVFQRQKPFGTQPPPRGNKKGVARFSLRDRDEPATARLASARWSNDEIQEYMREAGHRAESSRRQANTKKSKEQRGREAMRQANRESAARSAPGQREAARKAAANLRKGNEHIERGMQEHGHRNVPRGVHGVGRIERRIDTDNDVGEAEGPRNPRGASRGQHAGGARQARADYSKNEQAGPPAPSRQKQTANRIKTEKEEGTYKPKAKKGAAKAPAKAAKPAQKQGATKAPPKGYTAKYTGKRGSKKGVAGFKNPATGRIWYPKQLSLLLSLARLGEGMARLSRDGRKRVARALDMDDDLGVETFDRPRSRRLGRGNSRHRLSDAEDDEEDEEERQDEDNEALDELEGDHDETVQMSDEEGGLQSDEDYLNEAKELLEDAGVHLPDHTDTDSFMRDLCVALHAVVHGKNDMSEDEDEDEDEMPEHDEGELVQERPNAMMMSRRDRDQRRGRRPAPRDGHDFDYDGQPQRRRMSQREIQQEQRLQRLEEENAGLHMQRALDRLEAFERQRRVSPDDARKLKAMITRRRMSFTDPDSVDVREIMARLDMIGRVPKGTFGPVDSRAERMGFGDRQTPRTPWDEPTAITRERAQEVAEEQLRNSGMSNDRNGRH